MDTYTKEQQLLLNIIINKIDLTDCWLVKPATYNGYGQIYLNNKQYRAHRYSYQVFVGDIPDGMLICHTCDTRNCVNPKHLFIGTQKDNMQDMKQKGRGNHQKKTHCPIGHEYNAENTYIQPSTGFRECKRCRSITKKQRLLKKKGLDKSIQELDTYKPWQR